ncbi:M20 family metallopeptidase [Oceanobacillus timonensis]|uniref:M20 family metallopeptidase n=1 Tax=Oceanobacillus timonensis TaxID=1926285 RepID=UPI0009BAEFF2|nr:M20 family metallopeptidase [Oceanobacillus timonensis]
MSENIVKEVEEIIEQKREAFFQVSDQIWETPEIRYEEKQSFQCSADFMEEQGFQVERGVANIPTAFTASFGNGGPVIAILGEYDALPGLSQKAGVTEHDPVETNGPGHGCGHNLLGVGSMSAAVAVKEYLEKNNLEGTIRYYGCPAEESGYAKTYMVKAGLFDDVAASFSWHPHYSNSLFHGPSLAVIHSTFTFKGVSSHAAASPELGRSALDAVELMNVGANFLREHMIDEARVHYAITNTGGMSPNVVQRDAEVSYFVRAPHAEQARVLFKRLVKIAEGAALMTETSMDYQIEGACSNLVQNATLDKLLHKNMKALESPHFSEEELELSRKYYQTLNEDDVAFAASLVGKEKAEELAARPLIHEVSPYREAPEYAKGAGSTDVGAVSWVTPTAQLTAATWSFGTPFHTWQVVSQGKTSYAKKGMLYAGKAIASTVIDVLQHPEVLEDAVKELRDREAGPENYVSLLPENQNLPSMLRK